MKIAVVGPGSIGSTFAFHLARAGNDVTVVARGVRLAQLTQEQAIVKTNGERAIISVSASLNSTTPWDLVLVTVLAPQVEALLPTLASSAAKTIMFMFNTFEPLKRLQETVGAERFAFGFPAILATLTDGKLSSEIFTVGQVTTVTEQRWADLFTASGIKAVVHPDIESWLRTHAAMIVPFMLAIGVSYQRQSGISFGEAYQYAKGLNEGFRLVRKLGNQITPIPMKLLAYVPSIIVAAVLWSVTRSKSLRRLGAAGNKEPIALIESMDASAPGEIPKLMSLRS
jgi:2-dehydropantoate 2-reductase